MKTVESLKKNTLAKKTNVYFFSDAPKVGDETKVGMVRSYLTSVSGFLSVNIVERSDNCRVSNNRGGMEFLLNRYGKVIFMEDDIVTAPGFIRFVNEGLEFSKNIGSVFAVGGHTPNLYSLRCLSCDNYYSSRFHGWGFGIWKDRYEKISKIPSWDLIKYDPETVKNLKAMGSDMTAMIRSESEGRINAFDIRSCYYMAKNEKYMLLPKMALVKNIGLDGSGVHCGADDPYDDALWLKEDFNFDEFVFFNKNIISEYRKFYSLSLQRRIVNRIRKIYV
ncbi:hypothetical protein [Marinobacterium rhizophilum]|uniref:Glycosyl transferase family 2 n=1 Tax=Marinobacterium rhizophilum TaxID=420402 RepID=A0ABY5HPL8_9GAMM|nr:hypothetical protein [Marinobacterium rhizophilum]UTW14260.1 hypothetical protein KDW95_11725 [Marinobacterium rhizophilum]